MVRETRRNGRGREAVEVGFPHSSPGRLLDPSYGTFSGQRAGLLVGRAGTDRNRSTGQPGPLFTAPTPASRLSLKHTLVGANGGQSTRKRKWFPARRMPAEEILRWRSSIYDFYSVPPGKLRDLRDELQALLGGKKNSNASC